MRPALFTTASSGLAGRESRAISRACPPFARIVPVAVFWASANRPLVFALRLSGPLPSRTVKEPAPPSATEPPLVWMLPPLIARWPSSTMSPPEAEVM